jgi:drug/metabolite transporter (DMT)-like permease
MDAIINNPRTRGYVICFSSVAVLSMDSFFIRHVEGVEFYTFLFYRHLFAACAFAVLLLIDSGSVPTFFNRIKSVNAKAVATMINVTVYMLTFAMALRFGIVAVSLVIIASSPLFAAIISWIFIGETMETRTKVASLVRNHRT